MKVKPVEVKPVEVVGRAGLRTHLAASHADGSACSRAEVDQLARGGWVRASRAQRTHLFGGGAIVAWRYRCPGCKVQTLVVVC